MYVLIHYYFYSMLFSSVAKSCLESLQPHILQHSRLLYPSLSPGVCSNSCPLSRWYCLTNSSSALLFSFCLPSFIVSGYLIMNQPFTLGGQSIKSFSISPSSEYSGLISFRIDWFHLLAVQGTLGVFSSTTVQKHQFYGTQLSLWSNSHIHTWLLEKP